jgi:hypothetical protein
MSGPALRHLDSHSSIHEAALTEAMELTGLLSQLLKEEQLEKAAEVAYIAVEHWETRTLRHAESEEDGLYKELAETSPELKNAVIALTRDHTLLRQLVIEIKEILLRDGMNDQVLQRFQALILVDQLHNREEERLLPEH